MVSMIAITEGFGIDSAANPGTKNRKNEMNFTVIIFTTFFFVRSARA